MSFGIRSLGAAFALVTSMVAPVLAADVDAPPTADQNAQTKVIDTAGGNVGTVVSVQGDIFFVRTDKHEVPIPRSSFTPTEKGLLFGLTRAQLNAQVDAAMSQPLAEVGAPVFDPQGAVVGSVTAVDEALVTIQLASGAVQLPVAAFARGPRGPVIGETAESLEAKAAAASLALLADGLADGDVGE